MKPLLEVRDLVTQFKTDAGTVHAVDGISYTLNAGESLAIVGESGSGKSVGVLSLLRLIPEPPGRIVSGEVWFNGRNLLTLSKREMRTIRGRDMAMVFQDPMTSLNPVLTIGSQLTEALRNHRRVGREAANQRAIEMLRLVGIPDAARRLKQYPHQFSGGQRQRVSIAMALITDPALLIADEPTTALDVTIQAQITDLVAELQRKLDMAIIWITHDLGVVAGLVEKVAVMYAGRIIEMAPVDKLYGDTAHPYTLGLLESIPTLDGGKERLVPIKGSPPDLVNRPPGCAFAPRCRFAVERCRTEDPPLVAVEDNHLAACWEWQRVQAEVRQLKKAGKKVEAAAAAVQPAVSGEPILQVRDLKTHFVTSRRLFSREQSVVKAVDGVNFEVKQGETFGLVGESGCGKSTTGETILRLIKETGGEIHFNGQDLTRLNDKALRPVRRHMQMIFQDPYASLNPRKTVAEIISEGLEIHNIGTPQSRAERVNDLMEMVGLNRSFGNRYPHEFSGGQRQRVGIARALATNPSFIVADEPISALDVSIQAQVVNLLEDLKNELGLTYLIIAHDLAMVRYISDRVAVMYLGRIVELGDGDAIFDRPLHPYTQALQSAVPLPDPEKEARRERIVLSGDVPNPADPPAGCHFHPRCHFATDLCREQYPPLRDLGPAGRPHQVACHHAEQFV